MSRTDRRGARAIGLTGKLYYRQGKHAQAEAHQKQSLALASELDASPLEVADHWHNLANTLVARSRNREAREAYENALAILENELGPVQPRSARLYYDMASFLRETGEPGPAREMFEAALATWTAVHGSDYIPVADTHTALATWNRKPGS